MITLEEKELKADSELNEDGEQEHKKESSIFSKIRNIFIGLIVLAILIVGGFVAAVKYDVLSTEDVAMLNENLGLYRLPIVGNGKYFEVPEGVEWPPKEEEETKPEEPAAKPVEPEKPKPKPTEVKVDKKAVEEQRAQREAEEKKRIARLARIYESMKPEAAANALINVDWDTTVLIFQKMNLPKCYSRARNAELLRLRTQCEMSLSISQNKSLIPNRKARFGGFLNAIRSWELGGRSLE